MRYHREVRFDLVNIRATVLGVFVFGTIGILLLQLPVDTSSEVLTVTFLDVGQGDAIVIETPDGVDVLIDGGPDGRVLAGLADVLGPFDRTLDLVIATHPDADHIGGLIDVFERYEVATVLISNHPKESTVTHTFLDRMEREDAQIVRATAGQTIALGASTTLDVLFPTAEYQLSSANAASVTTRLTYGTAHALFSGDAPQRIEQYLVQRYGDTLASDLLKIGHHGSRTSTAPIFLETVDPTYGVISAGRDNSYGHPHREVLDRLAVYEIATSTTKRGSVMFYSDGVDFQQK